MKEQILNLVQGHFGWDRVLLSLSLLSIAILNLFLQYMETGNVLGRPYLTYLLIFLSFIIFIIGTKITLSIILLILGVIAFIDSPNISDLTAVLFFIFSFQLINNKKYAVIILIINILLIAVKASYKGMEIYQSFILLIGCASIYLMYYFIIYKDLDKKSNVKFKELTAEENKILEYMANGMSQKEAGYELGYDKYRTNYIVKEIRKKTGYDSLYEIMYRAGVKETSTSSHNK